MKIQALSSTHVADLVHMNKPQDGSMEYRQDTKVPSWMPYVIEGTSNNGTKTNQAIGHRQYSTVDRKVHALAFAGRCNSLKYYIALIRLDVIT